MGNHGIPDGSAGRPELARLARDPRRRDGRSQSIILVVTTATTPVGPPAISARIHTLNRPNMVSVGTIVWLSSELMFFAGLFGI